MVLMRVLRSNIIKMVYSFTFRLTCGNWSLLKHKISVFLFKHSRTESGCIKVALTAAMALWLNHECVR